MGLPGDWESGCWARLGRAHRGLLSNQKATGHRPHYASWTVPVRLEGLGPVRPRRLEGNADFHLFIPWLGRQRGMEMGGRVGEDGKGVKEAVTLALSG